RVKLLKVIADYAVSGFGGRQELYERFYSGDPLLLRVAQQFTGYDWSAPLAAVDRLLGECDLNELLAGAGLIPVPATD
ncbi:MAG TPA: 4-hydroxyphenylacetate 3-hydroxylase C-terminal domain-containing protein, partial [Dehalococcoidia bacterium]|nr:4-hydroxyphenylacetate 3-hydroxylase C-terminal domain-containing protein [Dehalococcoidia bacterium]